VKANSNVRRIGRYCLGIAWLYGWVWFVLGGSVLLTSALEGFTLMAVFGKTATVAFMVVCATSAITAIIFWVSGYTLEIKWCDKEGGLEWALDRTTTKSHPWRTYCLSCGNIKEGSTTLSK